LTGVVLCCLQCQEQKAYYEQQRQAFWAKKAELDREALMFADVMQSVSSTNGTDCLRDVSSSAYWGEVTRSCLVTGDRYTVYSSTWKLPVLWGLVEPIVSPALLPGGLCASDFKNMSLDPEKAAYNSIWQKF
jgi:hypothetical protein